MKKPLNEFGIAVATFCAQYGMGRQELAKAAGVSYDSMRSAGADRRPCTAAKEAVLAYMERRRAAEGRGA